MECLLSFIEFTQYQEYVMKVYQELHSSELQCDNEINITKFPSNIPQSAIVSAPMQIEIQFHGESDNFDDLYDLKKKAHRIYQRYIVNDAEFEINISGTQRDSIANMMDNYHSFLAINVDYEELVMMFDGVKNEMKVLLEFSLKRFKLSPEWSEVDTDRVLTSSGGNGRTD